MPANVLRVVVVSAVAPFGFSAAHADKSPKVNEEEWSLERLLGMGRTEIVELWEQCPALTMEKMNGFFLGRVSGKKETGVQSGRLAAHLASTRR